MSENGEEKASSAERDEKWSENTQKVLEDINCCQNEIDELNEKASTEILHVEERFNKMRKPKYDERSIYISKIPEFWLTTFLNHPQIASMLLEEDEDCLQYLHRLDVEEYEDIKAGYLIKFYFRENPYFENSVLIKEYHLDSTKGEYTSKATTIKWKPGMDFTKDFARAEGERVSRKRKRPERPRSFFTWLAYQDTSDEHIGEVIKDDIWPNPLQYYLINEDCDVEDWNDPECGGEEVEVVDEDDEAEETASTDEAEGGMSESTTL